MSATFHTSVLEPESPKIVIITVILIKSEFMTKQVVMVILIIKTIRILIPILIILLVFSLFFMFVLLF